MSRIFLILLACTFASVALAVTPQASEELASVCPKVAKTAAVTKTNTVVGANSATPKRVTNNVALNHGNSNVQPRTNTPHLVSARWHSFLPGMYR